MEHHLRVDSEEARFARRVTPPHHQPSPDEVVKFTVKGETRREILEGVKTSMSNLGVLEDEYRVRSIKYRPLVRYENGNPLNLEWQAKITCIILPRVPF